MYKVSNGALDGTKQEAPGCDNSVCCPLLPENTCQIILEDFRGSTIVSQMTNSAVQTD